MSFRVPAPTAPVPQQLLQSLVKFVGSRTRLTVLTGAGCSTESGIPDYRSPGGLWQYRRPMLLKDYMESTSNRQRYWARNMVGYLPFSAARPNRTHFALTQLQRSNRINFFLTQNVDRLHQASGSIDVVELHGNSHNLHCTSCHHGITRGEMQKQLEELNPAFVDIMKSEETFKRISAPDGDAELHGITDYSNFQVPDCEKCGGILKTNVIFFGENVAQDLVQLALSAVRGSDGLLVVGSSLQVWSGYRFARAAADANIPIALVSIGPNRADPIAELKVEGRCGEILTQVVNQLHPELVTGMLTDDGSSKYQSVSNTA